MICRRLAAVRGLAVGLTTRCSPTDPAHFCAHAVTGRTRVVSADTAVVGADVPTDVGLIRVTVASTGGRWLIDNARPAPTP